MFRKFAEKFGEVARERRVLQRLLQGPAAAAPKAEGEDDDMLTGDADAGEELLRLNIAQEDDEAGPDEQWEHILHYVDRLSTDQSIIMEFAPMSLKECLSSSARRLDLHPETGRREAILEGLSAALDYCHAREVSFLMLLVCCTGNRWPFSFISNSISKSISISFAMQQG
eukprot:g20080.t1